MSLTKRASSVIVADGVGRKDYSQNVEYSIEGAIRSLQERFFYSYQYTGLDALVFPNVYESLLQFLVDSSLQDAAPSGKPWMIYLAEATTTTNNLVAVSLLQYATYADYLAGTVYDNLGTALGFVDAKLSYTKGIALDAGYYYSVQYGAYSGVAFDLDLVIHGLVGGEEEI